MTFAPIDAVAVVAPTDPAVTGIVAPPRAQGSSFEQILLGGLEKVDADIQAAEVAVNAFAADDSFPVHQVMFALAKAQLSLELMLQVRSRLVEGYQEIMRMQL